MSADRLRTGLVAGALAVAGATLGAAGPATSTCVAGSPRLAGELEVGFPGASDDGTHVELTLRLSEARPSPVASAGGYELAGEILHGDRRVDGFETDLTPAATAGPIRLGVIRPLPAGHYLLHVQALERSSGRCLRVSRELDVPALGAGSAASAAAASAAGSGPSVRLRHPGDALLTGRVRFEADVRDAGVARVAFELDGRRVMTRGRAPWTVELDLGTTPRLHRVAAIALSAAGEALARDEIQVNGGPHRFAVRLALVRRPPPAAGGPEQVEVRAVVEVPEGETVDRVELAVNDEPRAVLREPPYAQPLDLPAGGGLVWVRAVAWLADGGAAEAVRLVGQGGATGVVEVDFVELHATVTDRGGRPVEDLTAAEVTLSEDGRPQTLRRFERVVDVPIHAGVLIDTSGSMVEELAEAERAALRFFEQVMTERDRAAMVTFADEPRLAVRFTGRRDRLAGGLVDLKADGETALYDAVVFALHYFGGLSGKRALVLLSDGADSKSKLPFDHAIEFARRAGVAIYTIGLNVPSNPPEPGLVLDRLARETGGQSFRVRSAAELGRIYEKIERELRSQYLLAYQSDAPGGEAYRRIEVEIKRPGVQARTVAGYYP